MDHLARVRYDLIMLSADPACGGIFVGFGMSGLGSCDVGLFEVRA